MKSKISFLLAVITSLFLSYSFYVDSQGNGNLWLVPEKYQKMKNPVEVSKESIERGKFLYSEHCKSCHGEKGLGDGPEAAQLDTPSGDFSNKFFQTQSDGSIFYKTLEGRDDMPGFKKEIPDAKDMWSVVNYVRNLD